MIPLLGKDTCIEKRWQKGHIPNCQQEIALNVDIMGIFISSLFSAINAHSLFFFLLKMNRFEGCSQRQCKCILM